MATNEKGSDLDVFEGLGKKGSPGPASSPPGAHRSPPPPPPPPGATGEAGHPTRLGIGAGGTLPPPPPTLLAPNPAATAVLRTPPPPPGRNALPRISQAAVAPAQGPARAAARGTSVDVEWEDDEDETTHIFDKTEDGPKMFFAPTPAAGTPPPPLAKSTLLGLTAPVLPPPGSSTPATRSGFPAPSSFTGGSASPRGSAFPGVGPRPGGLPTPPKTSTLPPPPNTQQGLGGIVAAPARSALTPAPVPVGPLSPSSASPATAPPTMSPIGELTALLRPQRQTRGLWAALALAVVVGVGAVVLLLPHTGRLVIDVNDAKGATINRVDIFVDGRKQCDTAPCIVEPVSAGPHEVKVLADGYDAPPLKDIKVESGKDTTTAFALATASKGTGVKVNASQAGVKLYVDDKEVGPLPQEVRDLPPGEHVVKIVGSERYQPLEKRVTIDKDSIDDLGTVTLKVLKGKATISSNTPGARVFLVSGGDRRELPMLPISVDIDTAKTWSLQASKLGYNDFSQPIGFDDGQAEKTYVVTLDPRPVSAPVAAYSPPPGRACGDASSGANARGDSVTPSPGRATRPPKARKHS